MPAKNAATPARISGMCRPLSLAVVPVVRRIKENVSLAVSVLGLCGGGVWAWLAGVGRVAAEDPVAFTSVVTTSFFAGVVACPLFPPLRASLDEAARRRELSRKVRSLSGRQLGMLRSLVDGEWLRAPVGDVGAEALVSLGLADRSRIGFGFDGDCLTLGLRYAAELRGDPDRWLAR